MRSPEAEQHFVRAKDFAGQAHPSASDGAGGHHLTMSAILEAKAALQLSPSDPEILLFLSGQLHNTLLTQEALLVLEEGVQAAQAAGRTDLLIRMKTFLAFILRFSRNDPDGARRALDEALLLGPGDPEALQLRNYLATQDATREAKSALSRPAPQGRTRLLLLLLSGALGIGLVFLARLCWKLVAARNR